jgi:hypothetical protein
MPGFLSVVFGGVCGGLETFAHPRARKIALKSRRLRPIQNWSDGNAQEGNVGTLLGFAGLVGLTSLALVARGSARRRRASIHAMLDRSRPCAQRIRD